MHAPYTLLAEDISLKAKGSFSKPWIYTRDELIVLSREIVDRYSSVIILPASFLSTDDPFESLLRVSLFNEAAAIEIGPSNFIVEFSRMQNSGHVNIFSSALEFVQNQLVKREIENLELKSSVHAIFEKESDHAEFMHEFMISEDVVSGGFIIEIQGIEGGGNIRIAVEQSWPYKSGLFLSLDAKLNRNFIPDDMGLLSTRVDQALKNRGLIVQISQPSALKESSK